MASDSLLRAAGTSGERPSQPPRNAVVEIVVPVYNEERDLGPSVRRLHAYLRDRVPVHRPDHDRRQRQHRRHLGGSPARSRPSCPASRAVHLDQKGRGRALRDGLVGERRRRRRLHGRRPVHRPRRAAAAGRAAAVRAQRRRDRHPAGPRRPGRARPEARGHLALLQPAAARRRCGPGSPTRSAASRRSAPTAPRALLPLRRGHAAGSSTPSCSCSPSAPACASTRCRSTGSTTPTRGSTSSRTAARRPARHRPAAHGWPGARSRRRCARPAAGREPPARPARAAGARSLRFAAIGVASTLAYVAAVPRCCARAVGAQAANAVALLRHRGREHRRQPAVHLRRPRPRRRGPPPGCRASRCSARPRADRRARSPCCTRSRPHAGRGRRARRARRREPGRHRRALRAASAAGCSAASQRRPRPRSCRDDRRTSAQPGAARPLRAPPRPSRSCGGSLPRPRRPATRPGCAPRCSALLAGTALLYLAACAAGWANAFYSAAVQAGHEELEGVLLRLVRLRRTSSPSTSRRRSLWVMELSARIFGAQLLEHPRAAGARGRRRRRRAVRHGAPLVRRRPPGCSPAPCWRSPRSPC